MEKQVIRIIQKSGMFSNLDSHFADFIYRLDGRNIPEIYLASTLVSNSRSQGHICLDLKRIARKFLFDSDDGKPFMCPSLGPWLEKLNNSPVVGKPGEFKPLVLDHNSKLYLYRYWDYQEKLANLIKDRIAEAEQDFDFEVIKTRLDQYCYSPSNDEIDWQRIAAFISFQKKFCVISGGPGTGKTTTIARIMAFLLEQNESKPPRIALAAPTGKAAARLQEAIKITKNKINCSDRIKQLIPEQTSTIHRLLRAIPNSPYFRYNAQNPLPVDVMIIDEASMVDLALMSKLAQALLSTCQLILVGDKDQLASVEAGAVLGDICDTGNEHYYSKQFFSQLKALTDFDYSNQQHGEIKAGIQDCIIQLKKSFRFSRESGIGAVSRAVNDGDGDRAIAILNDEKFRDAKWIPLPHANALPRMLRNSIVQGFRDYLTANDPFEAFQRFDQFRILCALREGPYGVSTINSMAENFLKEEKLINPEMTWYHGRPIMITSNDYHLNLFNGDIGIALRDGESHNEIRVFFIGADNTIRKFHPLRLPAHETVFAMTVHKSQGSEFDHVLLLLPDRDSPVLTRELIYTGITRARKDVAVWGVEPIFKNAVARRIERTSGLRDALWD
jgi:exodeoxyribonuclease V alpha subunit